MLEKGVKYKLDKRSKKQEGPMRPANIRNLFLIFSRNIITIRLFFQIHLTQSSKYVFIWRARRHFLSL
jgi:hypothetical protein